MRPFEPGLCSVTFRSLTPQVVIKLAASNGIRAIEWGADVHVPPGDLENARQVAARTAEAGLSVSSYGSYIFAPDFTPDDVTSVLETARALGTR
ncbi:sugar phosphate isomerase/epimerase, partial [Agrobacterium sp. S2]|nr:sugar phosphate isomerase/epimerase [Agrobacterium sp. S2]